MTNQLEPLEYAITIELESAINHMADQVTSAMADIQPPTSIAHAAAVAAAQVLMAFERGYRMGDYENGEGPSAKDESPTESVTP